MDENAYLRGEIKKDLPFSFGCNYLSMQGRIVVFKRGYERSVRLLGDILRIQANERIETECKQKNGKGL